MDDLLYGPPDNNPADQPASTPAPTAGAPAPDSSSDSPDWRAGLDPGLREMAQAKGWKSPGEALKSYASLEAFLGAKDSGRAVVLPKDENDAEAYGKIYEALGRPQSADEYGLMEMIGAGEGDGEINADFVNSMGAALHEAGLSKGQARKLAEAWLAQENAAVEAANQYMAAEEKALMASLSPAEVRLIRAGYRSTGLPQEMTGRVAMALGPRVAADIFKRLGATVAEDSGPAGRGAGGGGNAQREVDQLLNDPHFRRRYDDGEAEAVARISGLYQRIANSQK